MSLPSSSCYITTPYGQYLMVEQGEPDTPLILSQLDNAPGPKGLWTFDRCSEHEYTIRYQADPRFSVGVGQGQVQPNEMLVLSFEGVKFTPKQPEGNIYRFSVQGPGGEKLFLGPSLLRIFPPRVALVEDMGQPLDWVLKPLPMD